MKHRRKQTTDVYNVSGLKEMASRDQVTNYSRKL